MQVKTLLLTLVIAFTADAASIFKKRAYSMAGNKDADFVKKEKMLPRGSALITSSGKLEQQGITAIIHAATGSMTKGGENFDATPKSVTDSVRNSLILARRYNHKRVAIPFLAGGIFAARMGVSKQELATLIIEATLKYKKRLNVVFVLFTDAEKEIFQSILSTKKTKRVEVVQGSITNYQVHKASAIVNAANMEVVFGGGISGAIGSASDEVEKIDEEARLIISSI